MARSIVHIDLNAFFAQCEINEDPSLKGKPIAIGRNHKRGIVSTASYEARKYGVHSGMPTFQAAKLCPDLLFIPGHYGLYSRVSERFMSYLKASFPILEQVSIDECYIDMTDFINDATAHDFLFDLQMQIYQDLQLKCSIGYAHTKFLAKMASDYKKPLGLTLIYNDEYKDYFWPLSIDKMWGIGKKTAPALKEAGIDTIGKLAVDDSKEAKAILGSSYSTFKDWANGRGNDAVETVREARKSISKMETYIDDIDEIDRLKERLRYLAKDVSNELKEEKRVARLVVLTLRDSSFNTRSKRKAMLDYTSDFEKIYLTAEAVFDSFYQGEEIRLLGIGLDDVKSESDLNNERQMNLFDTSLNKEEKSEAFIGKLKEDNPSLKLTTLGELKKKEKE